MIENNWRLEYLQETVLWHESITISVLPPLVNINIQQDGHRGPDHEYEEEESVTYITCSVRDDADDKRTDERTRLDES